MHIFNVQQEITWKKKIQFNKSANVTGMSYNSEL